MRPIKFRAWDNKYGHMLSDMEEQPLSTLDRDRFIIEQYTGFKTRKGVEVYEGDIVVDDDDKVGTIIFYNGCFMVSFNHVEVESNSFGGSFVQGKTFDKYWDDDLTPLGNIHEHDIKVLTKEYEKKLEVDRLKSIERKKEYDKRRKENGTT